MEVVPEGREDQRKARKRMHEFWVTVCVLKEGDRIVPQQDSLSFM